MTVLRRPTFWMPTRLAITSRVVAAIAAGRGGMPAAARFVGGIQWTPAGLGARWVLGEARGELAVLALAAAAALGTLLALAAFRWSLGRPEATRSRKGVRRPSWLTRLLDRVGGPTGALVLKEAAYVARDPHLRLALILPIALWGLFILSGDTFGSAGTFAFIAFITLNTVGQLGTNLFGRDRAAFDAFLTAPLRGRQILFAKSLAHLFLFGIQLALLAALAVTVAGVRVEWVALIVLAAIAAALLLLAGGQWFSVTAPYAIDPRRRTWGPGGASIFLLLLFEIAVAAVVGIAVAVPYFLAGPIAAALGALAAALLGALAFRAASGRCGRLLETRREKVRHALLTRT